MTLEELAALHEEVFAPWVKALRIRPVEIGPAGARFLMPAGADLVRRGGEGGGVICGQALAAAGDTASVMALVATLERFRPCTTTDLSVRFLRPLGEGEVEIAVSILSNGRRMAATQAEFRAAGGGKLAATVSCGFAWLDA